MNEIRGAKHHYYERAVQVGVAADQIASIGANTPNAARNGRNTMPVRDHPFFQAPTGAVFAIAIAPALFDSSEGGSMGILSIVGSAPVMPSIDWGKPPIAWIFFSFAPNTDTTEAVGLGVVPFENESAEWAPLASSHPMSSKAVIVYVSEA